jgi:hypothetical protein
MEADNAEHDRIKDELAKQIAAAAYLAQPFAPALCRQQRQVTIHNAHVRPLPDRNVQV